MVAHRHHIRFKGVSTWKEIIDIILISLWFDTELSTRPGIFLVILHYV